MNPHQKSDNGGIEYQKADSDRQLWGARYTRDEVRQWFVDNGYVELDGGKFPKGERDAINKAIKSLVDSRWLEGNSETIRMVMENT